MDRDREAADNAADKTADNAADNARGKGDRNVSGHGEDFLEEVEEPGFLRELYEFLKENRRWWMVPLILALMLIGGLLFLAGSHSALAPFIYTLF